MRFKGDEDEDDYKQSSSASIDVFKVEQQIAIQSTTETITAVTVYDLLGRVLYETHGIQDKSYTIAALPIAQ